MLLTRPLDNASAINPHSVDWASVTPRNFPYYIRQKSGKGNALGTIIFMFPNPHNVFIHDTQGRGLFSREVRTLSHGCIRVENPHSLAHIVLASNGGWPMDRIRNMAKHDGEAQIPLKEAIPVHITYLTAWADNDGTINFRRDIYKRDDVLIKILARPTKAKRS
jgi:murein L,D-transpeptidase YcbB/YkuD